MVNDGVSPLGNIASEEKSQLKMLKRGVLEGDAEGCLLCQMPTTVQPQPCPLPEGMKVILRGFCFLLMNI